MPAEFLRDVVRPPQKRSRVWSMVPLSIAAHAVGVLAFFIIPLAAEEEPPPPAPLSRILNIMTARPIPPPPPGPQHRPVATATRDAAAVPTAAPDAIAEEQPAPSSTVGDTAPGGVDFTAGVPGGIGGDARFVPPPPPVPEPAQVRKPVRPGGDIREPKKIVHVAPIYPPIAISAGVHGIVILEATISETGSIENLRVLRSHPLLERAAIDAVRQWRYTPTRLNGVPVPIIMTVTVNFTLHR
jgi:protein TonB